MNDDGLKAGRELDALVAEKVMGWKRVADYPPGVPAWETKQPARDRFGYHSRTWDDFAPSTDIADAWEVVERMKDLTQIRYNRRAANVRPWVEFCTSLGGEWAQSPSYFHMCLWEVGPLTICRAALEAVRA